MHIIRIRTFMWVNFQSYPASLKYVPATDPHLHPQKKTGLQPLHPSSAEFFRLLFGICHGGLIVLEGHPNGLCRGN